MIELDITEPTFVADPYPVYRRLRQHPVVRILPFGVYGLTRYTDVALAFRNYKVFSSEAMHSFFATLRKTQTDPLGRTLVSMDPPRHFEVRRICAESFGAIDLDQLRAHVVNEARRLLKPKVEAGKLDFMADFAAPIALSVAAWVLGIEDSRLGDFKRWTDDATVGAINASSETKSSVEDSHLQMRRFFEHKIDELRQAPNDKLLSRLVLSQSALRLSEPEMLDLARFLLFAGNKTTRFFMGNALLALIRNPKELARLVEDPTLMSKAVLELLRYDTPSQIAIRNTTQDLEYEDHRIPSGSVVFLMSGSANHDDREFVQPERLDIERDNTRHLGLGSGIHHCLGDRVAQIQAEAALGEFLAAGPGVRVEDNGVEYGPMLFLRGLTRLDCRVD